jgi:predicted esterase
MNKRLILVFVFLFVLSATFNFARGGDVEFATYGEMRAEVGKLYRAQKYREAAEILEKGLDRFPDHFYANTYNLALMYGHLKQVKKGLKALDKALKKQLWFGKYAFVADVWAPYKGVKGFERFLEKNERLRQSAQKDVAPKRVVKTPVGYDTAKKYPLFIALHGGGENLEQFMPRWKSELLAKEFIVLYLQSSQMISMTGFNWTEDIEISKREIADAYEKTKTEYAIDGGDVLVGGFSSGGVAALETVLSGVVPVRGFVVLCPARPDAFDEKRVVAARDRGVSGTLLTTEMDGRIKQQREMAEVFKKTGLQYQFVVTPDIGHWYPDNLSGLIDRAIEHIRSR